MCDKTASYDETGISYFFSLEEEKNVFTLETVLKISVTKKKLTAAREAVMGCAKQTPRHRKQWIQLMIIDQKFN